MSNERTIKTRRNPYTKLKGDSQELGNSAKFETACHAGDPGSIPDNGAKFDTVQITLRTTLSNKRYF